MKKEKILVIEDDSNLREAICTFIEFNDLEFVSATNGTEALLCLTSQVVDMVVCDINLPDILGWEILKAVRNDPRIYNIPFIFLSAYADKTDVHRGLELGADEYVTKPFSSKELMDTIHFWLNKARKNDNLFNVDVNSRVLDVISKKLEMEMMSPLNGLINGTNYINSLPTGLRLKELPVDLKISDLQQTLSGVYQAGFRLQRDLQNYMALSSMSYNKNKELHLDHLNYNTDLKHLLRSVIDVYETISKKPVLESELNSVPKWVGSEKYIRIIFTELIDNAVKFNAGTELPRVSLLRSGTHGFIFSVSGFMHGEIEISLAEVGPFRKFHEDNSIEGLGLGLYVAKTLCELFGYEFSLTALDSVLCVTVKSTPELPA